MTLESISISSYRTTNVKTVQSNKGLFETCRIMKNNGIGSVIVVDESDNDNPVGIITERDIVNYLSLPEIKLRMQIRDNE